MSPPQPPKVLVLAKDAQVGRVWAQSLASVTPWVWTSPAEVPADIAVEVVLTDLPLDDTAGPAGGHALGNPPPEAAHAVTIAVGSVPGADFAVPPDFTPRELGLACLLAGEIARLRIARDEVARDKREVMQLADTDPLTGLANRRAWTRQLERHWLSASTSGQPLWLALVDLDEFKQVNDHHGYAAGDQVLEQAARALAGQLRKDDVLARLGGDEFGVLLEGPSEEQARAVFERLIAAVAAQQPPAGAQQPTASIGYASSQSHSDIRPTLSAAEQALREAKRSGGNRVCRAAG